MQPVKQIEAAALTTFEVDPDGTRVRLNVRDCNGSPAALVLPVEALNELLMTIPRMITLALQKGHEDESLRVVYPLEHFSLELAHEGRDGVPQFMLTLETNGGFAVSFAGSADCLASLARSIFGDSTLRSEAELQSHRLS